MKIFIDPGHGGHDSGAVGNGLREKDLTLDISLRQLKLFTKLGHEVKISRTKDVFVSLSQRVNQANAWGADIFISNHINDGGGIGEEVWCSIHGGKGREYAEKVESLLDDLLKDRGVKTRKGFHGDYLYVIRNTRMSAILNEFGFIDNLRDTNKLKDSDFRQKLAEAVVRGITGKVISNKVESTNAIDGKIGTCTGNGVRVRSSMSTNSTKNILGHLYKGDNVKLFKKVGDWYELYYGSHGGYVSAKYIELI